MPTSPASVPAAEASPPPSEPPAGGGSMASSSLWAAVSQVAILGIQGIAAFVILLRFGKGADTDAVFAAYGVYGVLLIICQTLRLTVVARVVESPSRWAAFDRFLGAGISLLLVAGAAQLLLGDPIAGALTGDLGAHAQSTARWTLAILWVAVGAQLVAALGAAVLGVRGEFRYPGLSFVAGGVVNIAVLLALSGPVGILSVATGVTVGSLCSAAAIMARLRREGYRPQRARVAGGLREWRTSVLLLVAATATVMTQLNFVISASFAARLSVGAVTIYTTAYFGGAVILALTAGAAALVLAAPVAQTWDRRPAGLLPHLETIMRAGLLLIAPAVAVAALVGDDLLDVVLGSSFSAADADSAIGAFVALSGLYVGVLAMQLPLLAAYALSRYNAVAALTVLATGVHVAATAVALQLGGVAWLGGAASLSALTAMALVAWLVFGACTARALALVVRDVAVIALVCVGTFGPPGVAAAALGSGGWDVAAAALGAAAFALVVHTLLPRYAAVAHRMVSPLLPARLRAATA
jgi:peptidoglycan biosynthesis protein MviN/MurJ (putative lipid II flippase)